MNFIALQNSYDDVQIGLFTADLSLPNNLPQLIDQQSINKINASKLLIPTLNQFFMRHNLTLTNIPFIAVNQGPGPFTTLRVIIATVNGISFAAGTPLIGISALDAAAAGWQSQSPNTGITAVLFNGFASDVYFSIQDNDKQLLMGCKNINVLLNELKLLNQPITFIGNGTTLHATTILAALGDHAIIPAAYPAYSTIEQIGILGYQSWLTNKAGSAQILPLYLKNHPVQSGNIIS